MEFQSRWGKIGENEKVRKSRGKLEKMKLSALTIFALYGLYFTFS